MTFNSYSNGKVSVRLNNVPARIVAQFHAALKREGVKVEKTGRVLDVTYKRCSL